MDFSGGRVWGRIFPMITTETLIKILGGNAVFVLVLGYLIKYLIERKTKEEFERQKHEYDQKLESVKAEFALINAKNSFRYSLVFTKTEDTIDTLIKDLIATWGQIVDCADAHINADERKVRYSKADSDYANMIRYMMNRRLYVPENIDIRISQIHDDIETGYACIKHFFAFIEQNGMPTDTEKKSARAEFDKFVSYNQALPIKFCELQKQCRIVLGVPILEPKKSE